MFDAFVNNAADFSLLQSAVTFQSSAGLQTVEAGWINYPQRKAYFRTNLLFPSTGARSPGVVLGASIISLTLCLGSLALQLLSSLFQIKKIPY
jgi:hypothetical protein